MKKSKSLSVVIPLYNKELFIEYTLDKTSSLLKNIDYEILVVENESTDNSKNILLNYIEKNNLPIKTVSTKKGLGNALVAGIKGAEKDYIMTIPADFTSGVSEIEFFLKSNNFKYVIGSRAISSNASRPKNRIFISTVLTFLNRLFLNIKIKDTQFTFIIENNLAKELVLDCKSSGFYISAELIYFALKKGIPIKEIPVKLTEDERNSTTIKFFSDSFSIIRDILRIFLTHGRL